MNAEIDRLEVAVESSASKANAELNKLVNRLEKVARSLSKINGSGLTGFANGIEKLGKSLQTVNAVKTSDFTRLANNIKKISNIDQSGLNRTASALNVIGRSLNSAGAAAKSSETIASMAKNLGKLGGSSIQKAIQNLPTLATELKKLMITLAQSPNVSKNVIQMTNALANLSDSLKGVSTSNLSGSAAKSTGVIQRLSNAFSGLNGQVGKSNKSMRTFSQIAGSVYANWFMVLRGIQKLGNAIESAMDYVETYNYFSVTMDKIGTEFGAYFEEFGYDSAEAYVDSFSGRLNELTRKMTGYRVGEHGELFATDNIGLALDPEAIMNYQSSIAAITNSVGLIGENSINASKALTMLSVDLSSLKNVDLSTAMNNLQSGLIGQSRALYKYGIDITNNTLQTYAYELGINKAVSAMTQAEKMQLRLVAILDQSRVAWGDQANTINSVANQYRILKQQISNLARIIGNLFLPIVQKVLPVINGVVIAIQRLFTALGFKIWGGDWLKDTMDGIGGEYADDSLEDLGDSADDVADSMDNAAAAAQKLRTMTLGIDELNINSPDDASGSGSGDSRGEIDLSGVIVDDVADYEAIWDEALVNSKNKVQEYADAICAAFNRIWQAIEPFREAVSRLWNEGMSQLASFTFENLKNFYNEFLAPLGMWAFGTEGFGLTRLVDVINNSLLKIDWTGITANLKVFWAALEPYAEQFGEGLIDFFEDIANISVDIINRIFGKGGAIEGLTNWLNNNDPERARKWGYTLGQLAVGMMALKGIGTVISGIAGIGTALSGIRSGLSALFGSDGLFVMMGTKISGLFAQGGVFGGGGLIVKGLTGIRTAIASMTGGAIVAPLGVIAAAIVAVTAAIADLWKTSEKFRNAVKGTFDQIKNIFVQNFSEVTKGISEVTANFGDLVSCLYEIYDNSPLKDLVELIGVLAAKLIGFAVSNAISTIGNMIQGFCSILNGAISVVKGFVQVLSGLANLDGAKILSGFQNIGSGIVDIFTGAVNATLGAFGDLTKGITDWIEDFISNWTASMSNWWSENVEPWFTREKWEELYKNIKDSLKTVFDNTVLQWKSDISKWWNENVAPWFTAEKWKTLYTTIKTSLKTKFDETVTQWKSDISRWWNENVAPWFTASRWLNLVNTIKTSFSTKWNETVTQWKSNIRDWWDNHVAPWFTASKWLNALSGIVEGFKGAFKNAANAAIDVVNRLIRYLNDKLHISWDGFELPNGDHVGSFSMQLFKISEIPHFAEGGYPETGQLFMARENGITEMVGAIGNRVAVANNDQIISGIKQGVYEAVMEAMMAVMGQDEGVPEVIHTSVELDGKVLVEQTDEVRRRRGWNFRST